MIQQFEDIIINLLKEQLKVSVKAYPQHPAKYFLQHSVGEVLVRYAGRTPQGDDLSGAMSKHKYNIEIVFVFRRLRDDGGVYNILNEAYQILQGVSLTDTTSPLSFADERFLDENNGVWQYGQKWTFEHTVFNQLTDEYGG